MNGHALPFKEYASVARPGPMSDRGQRQPLEGMAPVESLPDFADRVFEDFLEAVPDAVVIADQSGRIIFVNDQAERLFGYFREELLGREVELLMPERFRERHARQRMAYVEYPTTRPMATGLELYGLRKNGIEFPIEINLSPFRLPFKEAFVVASAIRDVSEQRRIEDELRERARKLEEADRHKDEFLGILAHELRNPLGTIRNAAEVLGQFALPDSDLRLAGGVIVRQAEQMAHLVEDLLDVARIAQGKVSIRKEPVELDQAIGRAVETSQRFLDSRKQQLTISLPTRPVQLTGDLVRLVQILTNLLNNAAKYTDEGGRISLSAVDEGGEIVIRVRDTGIGIASEMLPRVFDLFTQVPGMIDRSVGGIGIGLAMVDHLVQLHGGTVQALSDGPGRGSEFVVRLPLASIPPGQDAAARTCQRTTDNVTARPLPESEGTSQ